MKHLLKELRYYKKEVILAPLFKMIEALLDLFVPLVMKRIMDIGIPNHDIRYIVWMCVTMVGIAIVSLLCAVVAQYFAAKAATGFSARLRTLLFKRIQELRFSELDAAGASTLITRMTSDADQVQNGVNLTLRLFLRSPFIVFGAMIMAFIVDVKAAIIFVVMIPVLMIVVFGIMLVTMPMHKKVQGALDHVTGRTRENLKGVRVIRAFRLEKGEIRRFIEDTDNLKKFQEFVGFISGILHPATFILIHIATCVILYVGAVRVDAGALTVGAVVALVNYSAQILTELVKFANLVIQMTRAGASLSRIDEVLKRKPRDRKSFKDEELNLPGSAAVEFKNVSLRYESSKENTLTDINFTINPGESVGIIGGTGSGKTSLVSLIPGYYKATAGAVLVNGMDVTDMDPVELKNTCVTVMQKPVIFSGTVRENLVFGLSEAAEKEVTDDVLEYVLKVADAYDFVMAKEGGLDALCEQDGRNFSGGQKQRLGIARALLLNPEILILDDSASALDFATDARIRSNMKAMRADLTTITVSQRATGVMGMDRIFVMDNGRLVAVGTHEQLMESCDVYKEIVNLQM